MQHTRLFVSASELAISQLTPSAGTLRPEAQEEQRDPAGEEAEQSGRTGEPARVPPGGRSAQAGGGVTRA